MDLFDDLGELRDDYAVEVYERDRMGITD